MILPLLIPHINKKIIKSLELYFNFHILKSHSLIALQKMSKKLGTSKSKRLKLTVLKFYQNPRTGY